DSSPLLLVIFFFHAEDGIRVFHVTGVQTCALPISSTCRRTSSSVHVLACPRSPSSEAATVGRSGAETGRPASSESRMLGACSARSAERRGGRRRRAPQSATLLNSYSRSELF